MTEPEPGPRGPKPDKLEAAKAFLLKVLADGAWHPSKPIIAAAKEEHGIGYRTLKDAADSLNVLKTKKGFADGWHWSLSDTPNNSATSTDSHGERDFSEDATYSATSSKNGENREDAEFPTGQSATSAEPVSPNHFNNSADPENAEDAEFREAPDADLY